MLHASALAGACAGLVSSILTCPLDVVKTKLQAQGGSSTLFQVEDGASADRASIGKDGGATRAVGAHSSNAKAEKRQRPRPDGLSGE
jgi:solute carrier family 25 folate transporter 32